jgi:opacity protein-like surface antigen
VVKFSRVVCLLALVWAPAAWAIDQWTQGIDGVGRISIMGGWKQTPNDYFFNNAAMQGHPVESRGFGGVQGAASFGYGATRFIEASVDLFVGMDQFKIAGYDTITTLTYGALLGVRFTYMDLFIKGFAPFIGFGVGPTLGYVTTSGVDPIESLVTGVAGTAGLSYRVAERVAITLEYRFLYARAKWVLGGVNVGANWLSLGVVVYFPRSPSESDRMLQGP